MTKVFKFAIAIGAMLLLSACVLEQAIAQESNSLVAQDGDEWWVNIIEAVLSPTGIIAILLAWVATFFKAKTGIDIDVSFRNGIHAALTNWMRKALVDAGWLPGKPLTPALISKAAAQAAIDTKTSNPDGVKHFNLSNKELEEMAVGKVPVITAEATPVAAAKK